VLRGGGGGDELRGWGDGDELDGGAGRDVVSTVARRLVRTPDRALLRDGEVDELACAGSGVFAEADADDELEECAPAVVIHRRGQIRPHRWLTLFVRCPVATAVPCRGRVWVHLQGRRRPVEDGRRLSRAVRFGPIRAGERTRLRVLIRGRVPRGAYVYATAVTRRNDGLNTRTITANVLP
jgi:hypothetical protein